MSHPHRVADIAHGPVGAGRTASVYPANTEYKTYMMNRTHGLLGSRFVIKVIKAPMSLPLLTRQIHIYQKLAMARHVVHLLHWMAKFESLADRSKVYWVDSHARYTDAKLDPLSPLDQLTYLAIRRGGWKWVETCLVFQEFDGTLEHLVNGEPVVERTPKQNLGLCSQLAEALYEIHHRDIYHTDFHEYNILYRRTRGGGGYDLAVSDFGEAIEIKDLPESEDMMGVFDIMDLGQNLLYICLGVRYIDNASQLDELRQIYGQPFVDLVEAALHETLTPREIWIGLRDLYHQF